jgi:type I restriction enzyme S subunit
MRYITSIGPVPSLPRTTLGDICRLEYGESLKSETRSDGKIPVFGSNGPVGFHNKAITRGPTIVIGRKGSSGEVNWSSEACFPIDTTYYVDRTSKPCELKWLYYALVALDLPRLEKSSAVPGLNREDVYKQCILFPSLPVQRRIAGILDKADRLRRMRRYALELSDQFLPALFLRMFGAPRLNLRAFATVPAGELFDIQLGKMLDEKRYTGKHLRPYLGNVNVQWGRFDLVEVKMMDFPPEDFERFRLRAGDILVCEGGEVGRTAIWRGEIPDCCYQKAVHRLRLQSEEIRPVYFQWFMWAAVQKGLVAKETSTSTIGHFTAERFNDFPVMLPPTELQDRFIDTAGAHGRLTKTHCEALRQAEHLFQSLLNQHFGEEDLDDQA